MGFRFRMESWFLRALAALKAQLDQQVRLAPWVQQVLRVSRETKAILAMPVRKVSRVFKALRVQKATREIQARQAQPDPLEQLGPLVQQERKDLKA